MTQAVETPATRRSIIFSVVSVALLMNSLDQTIVATALHDLQHSLHTSVALAGWTLTAYSLGRVLMLPLVGRISEAYGARRLFVASIVVFATASLFCGLVSNIYLLIVLRILQALGGAGFTPSATSIVVVHFGRGRDKALGLFGSIFPIGAAIGPVLGGVIVSYWSWREVFLVNVPVAVLLVPFVLRFIPADPPRVGLGARGIDGRGVVLLCGTMAAGMVGVTMFGASDSSVMWWGSAFLALCVLLVAVFMRHIGRVPDPIIPRRLITGPGFGAVNMVNFVFEGAVAGMVALVPLYAVSQYGITELGSGTVLVVESVAIIVFSALSSVLIRATGYRMPMYLGFGAIVVGMFGLAGVHGGVSAYLWLSVSAGFIGLGLGWSGPASRNACLQLIPDQAASLAALRSTGRQVGSISAISVSTAIVSQGLGGGNTQGIVYLVFGLLLITALPLVSRIPEHRGAW